MRQKVQLLVLREQFCSTNSRFTSTLRALVLRVFAPVCYVKCGDGSKRVDKAKLDKCVATVKSWKTTEDTLVKAVRAGLGKKHMLIPKIKF